MVSPWRAMTIPKGNTTENTGIMHRVVMLQMWRAT